MNPFANPFFSPYGVKTLSSTFKILVLPALRLTVALVVLSATGVTNARGDNAEETLDHRLQSLYRQVRCPVCPAQPISESEAPLSRILRDELRKQIASGKSEKEAIAWLVERYGEGVLLKPRFNSAALLWLAPLLCALVVLGVLYAYVRNNAYRRPR